MKKYIVHGNTGEDYCTDTYTIFGIFDSEKEAEQFILDYNKRAGEFYYSNHRLISMANEQLQETGCADIALYVISKAEKSNLVAFIQRDGEFLQLFEFEIDGKRPIDTHIHVFEEKPLVAMYACDKI